MTSQRTNFVRQRSLRCRTPGPCFWTLPARIILYDNGASAVAHPAWTKLSHTRPGLNLSHTWPGQGCCTPGLDKLDARTARTSLNFWQNRLGQICRLERTLGPEKLVAIVAHLARTSLSHTRPGESCRTPGPDKLVAHPARKKLSHTWSGKSCRTPGPEKIVAHLARTNLSHTQSTESCRTPGPEKAVVTFH